MWVDRLSLAQRFQTQFSTDDKKNLKKALTFKLGDVEYYIKDVHLEVDNAYMRFIEYELIEPLPKQISTNFLGHTLVVSKLTDSSRQNISLFFPPQNSCTDIVISFLRESDINHNVNPEMFSNCLKFPRIHRYSLKTS